MAPTVEKEMNGIANQTTTPAGNIIATYSDALHRADRRRGKVECHVCGVKFRKGSLASHLATQHGVYHSHLLAGADTCQPVGESRTFWARHLPAEGVWQCPVPDCPLGREGKGAASEQALRLHFSHRHPNGRVGVGGNLFPRCEQCGVQTRDAGSVRHEASTYLDTFQYFWWYGYSSLFV